MSPGERPTLPGFDASAFTYGARGPEGDDDPPSGVVLRDETLGRVPRVLVSASELLRLPLDHRVGFILSLVDGLLTVEMILDACAMRPDEAFAILSRLAVDNIIAL
jgi:hypothetical protein